MLKFFECKWHPQILADQLTLSQPGGADYTHRITTGSPGFSDLSTALVLQEKQAEKSRAELRPKRRLLYWPQVWSRSRAISVS